MSGPLLMYATLIPTPPVVTGDRRSSTIGSVNGRTKVAATQIAHARNAAANPTMTAFAYTTENKYERPNRPIESGHLFVPQPLLGRRVWRPGAIGRRGAPPTANSSTPGDDPRQRGRRCTGCCRHECAAPYRHSASAARCCPRGSSCTDWASAAAARPDAECTRQPA